LERASSIELGKEGLVSISVEDRSRSRAAQIANAYAEELRQLTQNLAVSEAAQRRLFFEQHMQLAQNKLALAEQALKETEQRTGVIQLDGQAKSIIESVAKLRATIAAKQIELRALRISSTEQNPDVMFAEQQLSGMQGQLARLEGEGSGPGQRAITAGSVPEAGLEYVRKWRDLKYAETIWDILTREYEAARLDEARDAAVIQVVDMAIEPDRKSSPQRLLIITIAALLGFCVSGACALLSELLHRLRLQPELEVRFRELKAAVLSRTPPPS
jgi:capsule polysaccharide export protein KpsE/RkpR